MPLRIIPVHSSLPQLEKFDVHYCNTVVVILAPASAESSTDRLNSSETVEAGTTMDYYIAIDLWGLTAGKFDHSVNGRASSIWRSGPWLLIILIIKCGSLLKLNN